MFGMGGPTSSISYRQRSSQDHVTTQAPPLRQSHHHQLQVHNDQSKHNCLFLKDVSYMFRLKYLAIIRLVTKTKRKNSGLRGFDISDLTM
jgi:hypothetical protein